MSLVLFLVTALLLVLVALLPVKIAAHLVGARNPAFMACLLAVVLAVALNFVVGHFVHYGFFISALLTGAVYMGVLETTYVRGVLIALLQVVVAIVLKWVLGILGFMALVHILGNGFGATGGAGGWV